jgi:hypothetical protein
MKEVWEELRLYIAEKLLSWAFSIAPEKAKILKGTILQYFQATCKNEKP